MILGSKADKGNVLCSCDCVSSQVISPNTCATVGWGALAASMVCISLWSLQWMARDAPFSLR